MSGTAVDAYKTEWLQQQLGARTGPLAILCWLREVHGISDGRVLELGSATGSKLQVFREHNELLGLEALGDAAAIAKTQGVPTLQVDL